MVTDVFSEELLPNKIEQSTNNPFDTNTTSTTLEATGTTETTTNFVSSTLNEELLNASTVSDLPEVKTEKEIEVATEKQVEEQGIFPCGERTVDTHHPWIVVLVHTDPNGRSRKKTLSKGVLIDRRHVLTTVSSLHNSRPFWIVCVYIVHYID